MLLIPLTWAIIFFVLVALGGSAYSLHCVFMNNNRSTCEFFQIVWLGYAVLIAILQLYSIFFAIDQKAVLVVSSLGIIGILFSCKTIWQSFTVTWGSIGSHTLVIAGIAILALLIAHHASQPLQHYDTELYHLNAVKWATSYPAIPGIVNIHGRLAFNSSFQLFAALLNNGYWANRVVYVANGFIVFVACIQWLVCLSKKSSLRSSLSYSFAIVTSPFLILSLLRPNLSSLSTDLVTQILILVTIYHLLDVVAVENGVCAIAIGDSGFLMMFIVLMSALVFSSKLSGAIILAIVAPAIVSYLFSTKRLDIKTLIMVGGPAIILLSGLIARYVILSGWVLYPFPFGNLHLDWSAPSSQVQWELDWVRSWARMPGKHPSEVFGHGFLHWFLPWYRQFFAKNWIAKTLLSCGIIGALYICHAKSTQHFRSRGAGPLILAIVVTILGVLFWFFTAPDYRFGEIFFWCFAGACLAPVISVAIEKQVRPNFLVFSAITIFLLLQKLEGGFPEVFPDKVALWNLPEAKSRKTIAVRVTKDLSSPLVFFRPLHGDRCGNSPLPCFPGGTPESNIELRMPGELKSGFRLHGL